MNQRPSFQIDIPGPCAQSWEEMRPEGQGRFCDHCQKTVIDFTTWTDAMLYDFFKKEHRHVCGRYLASQVNRPIYLPPQPRSKLYRMMVGMGLILMSTAVPDSYARVRPPLIAETKDIFNGEKELTADDVTGSIKGRVVDNKGEPIINASVEVVNGNITIGKAFTDYDGWYEIDSLSPGRYDVYVHLVTFVDERTIGVIISQYKTTWLDCELVSSVGNAPANIKMYKVPLIDPSKPGVDAIITGGSDSYFLPIRQVPK